jgi:uncharacterized protein
MLATPGEPLLYSDWLRPVFVHYEVAPDVLQPTVPFALDLCGGSAFVSVVAFTMRGLRPAWGGRWTSWCLLPIATHGLLNVRTYVRHQAGVAIYFLSEWIPNRLSVLLGPRTFGLPYLHARLAYDHDHENGLPRGSAAAGQFRFSYRAVTDPEVGFQPCAARSSDEFLLERYTAFTSCAAHPRFFRVWHPPWLQTRIEVDIQDDSLLAAHFAWFRAARLVGANYSPGLERIWMGRPHRVA